MACILLNIHKMKKSIVAAIKALQKTHLFQRMVFQGVEREFNIQLQVM